ncbi:MAG TPA: YebC/PmpR family DNA-binding transcriptional regulator, partial [Candidatus Sumerlaeia bacterium]|nr:YebC/PmpR family DNA-binding transcriptional regulator [Candidatus Sumerlaeia bacterium]
EAKSYKILGSEVILTPQNTVAVDEKHGLTLMKLLNNLEEHDDVSRVSANYDISDEIMERIQEQL